MRRCIWISRGRRSLVLAGGLLAVSATAWAGTAYLSANVRAEGDGTAQRPFGTVDQALAKAGPGGTVIFEPGVYYGGVRIPKEYAGTVQSPTVIRSEKPWAAIIRGAPGHGISVLCDWVTVDGFVIAGSAIDGIKPEGSHIVVRNSWVHHNTCQGILTGGNFNTIENCLIEFNGSNIQFEHGVYAQGEGLIIRNNIVRHNAGIGMQLYPNLRKSLVANNLVYANSTSAGLLVACTEKESRNLLLNNTVAGNGAGLVIWGSHGDLLFNNIIADNRGPNGIQHPDGVTADYNLCLPADEKVQGPHGFSADPKFVEARRGAYWLAAESPARGKGTAAHVPDADFWSRPRAPGRAPDLGAFVYEPFLTTPQARNGWNYEWLYSYGGATSRPLSDLWLVPPTPSAAAEPVH